MYAVRATAAYKRRDWSAVVVEASACAKGLAAAQPSLLLKLAKGHGPSGVLRHKVGSCVLELVNDVNSEELSHGALVNFPFRKRTNHFR